MHLIVLDKLIDLIFYFILQLSGLPLKLSVKFQINMALDDMKNMAHVSQFSNIVIPMLWFEIVSEI